MSDKKNLINYDDDSNNVDGYRGETKVKNLKSKKKRFMCNSVEKSRNSQTNVKCFQVLSIIRVKKNKRTLSSEFSVKTT